MPQKSGISLALASAFAILTLSVIAGTITMAILYKIQIEPMNPTPHPTIPSTTLGPPPVMRLPKNLVPENYRIFLKLHFYSRIIEEVNVTSPNQTLVFNGNTTIHFHCVQVTNTIFLHSKDLLFVEQQVMNRDTNEEVGIKSLNFTRDDESNFLEILLDENLVTGGNYSLFLMFGGMMSDNLEALYMSTYIEGNPAYEGDTNAERFLAATHLQPTDARKVFPCFDEPEMKAVFHLTIIHRRKTTALSNTKPSVSNIIDDDWKYTTFSPTPKMSTYLLAFTVSEFTETRGPTHRVDIKTYARPEATDAESTKYSTNITAHILSFYEKHFEMEYNLNKLEQIALPDLTSLAMENWGLITYQEGLLLYEEGVSSLLHKEAIATVIAHELAHQWFGNLVTLKWWSDVWLNEGFATYMSHFAVDYVEPSFKIKDMLIMSNLHAAFEVDALTSSHPLSASPDDVQTTSEIFEMFDEISYSKGAMVLRMLADFVGQDAFNRGIRRYLATFKGRNTDQNDLWESIQMEGVNTKSITIAELMKPWTEQMGYPVVTINTISGEVYQNQFLFNNSVKSSLWWHVPIEVMSEVSATSLVWLDTSGPVHKEEFISQDEEWILANVNCAGYFRVNYNLENWQRLLTQLETNRNRIPMMNRGQLVDDAFNLARAKLVDVTLALNSTRFLSKEREYLPWESAVRNLAYFVQMFDRTEVYGPMQLYLREQVKGLYNFFRGYTDNSTVPDDHSSQYNQINAIEVACSNGLPECVEMVKVKFANWMVSEINTDTNSTTGNSTTGNSTTNGNTTNSNTTTTNNTTITKEIHPNLRSVIYCQAVAAGGKKEWEFVWDKYQNSIDTSEKDQLRKALSCSKKTWLLSRYLEETLNPDKIRLMDVAATINDIAENAAGQALAWNFIRAHWDYVSQGDAALLIQGVTSRFNTKFELEELQRFAETYEMEDAYRTVQQAIEQTQVNIEWVAQNRDVVLQWFEEETAHLE